MARTIRATGPRGAKIAIVGEAPGRLEEQRGEPFVGPSGKLLWQMVGAAGFERRDCYVTNVAKERPRGNDFRLRYYEDKRGTVEKAELRTLWRELEAELLEVKPNVTVALGEEPLRALTGRRGIGKWRGSILATPVGKVVATYHPAGVMRKYIWRRVVEHDLRRVKEEGKEKELHLPEHLFIIDPSFEEVMDTLGGLRKGTKVAYDIETLGSTVRCIAFAWSPLEAISVPFVSTKMPKGSTVIPMMSDTPFHSHWTREEEVMILDKVERVLGDPSIPLIAQNHPFDASFMEREFGIVCRGLVMDTMVAHHCCYCELPKSLDFLCSFYTRVPYYADYNASSDVETWRYNCYDAAVTLEVAGALEVEMKELGI